MKQNNLNTVTGIDTKEIDYVGNCNKIVLFGAFNGEINGQKIVLLNPVSWELETDETELTKIKGTLGYKAIKYPEIEFSSICVYSHTHSEKIVTDMQEEPENE